MINRLSISVVCLFIFLSCFQVSSFQISSAHAAGPNETFKLNQKSKVRAALDRFDGVQKMSAEEIVEVLSRFEEFLRDVIESSDRELHNKYRQAFHQLSLAAPARDLRVVMALTRLEYAVHHIFGEIEHRNYFMGPFPANVLPSAIRELMISLPIHSKEGALSALDELVSFAETERIRWNAFSLSSALFHFSVQNKIIHDSRSLIWFSEQIVPLILSPFDQASPVRTFLSSDFPLTLSFLKNAKPGEALAIIRELHGEHRVVAMEEWLRVGSREGIQATDYLNLLEAARSYGDYWREGFGSLFHESSKKIFKRVHKIGAALVKEFEQSAPSSDEVKTFKKVSNLKLGEYTFFKLRKPHIGARDYKIESGAFIENQKPDNAGREDRRLIGRSTKRELRPLECYRL